jgi:hypothetical protein
MSQVVLKFGAFSNISHKHTYETGLTREEWDELTDAQRQTYYDEAIWDDIDAWDEDEE